MRWRGRPGLSQATTVLALVAALIIGCGSARSAGSPTAETSPSSIPATSGPSPGSCATDDAREWSPGVQRFTSIPGARQPRYAAFDGTTLLTVAPACDGELVLWRIDTRSGGARAQPLGMPGAGGWGGLDVTADGSVWVCGVDQLARIRRSGAIDHLPVPSAQHRLPLGFRGPGEPNAVPSLPPTLNGQITSLVALRDVVLIGRAGFRELTVYRVSEERFESVELPSPLGDVQRLARAGTDAAIFSINRSVQDPIRLSDSTGHYDARSGRVSALAVPAQDVAGAENTFAFSGWRGPWGSARSVLVRAASDGAEQAAIAADGYDPLGLAVRGDGLIAVRAAGNAHEIVFIDPSGRERRRVEYAAVQGHGRPPYGGRLSMAGFAPDGSFWFGIWGRPDLYRIMP
jgi:hypothetical protein